MDPLFLKASSMSFLIAMATYALTLSITPGPVNLMTLSSGLSHGVLRTLPFVSGATIGFTSLLFLISVGLAEIITHFPDLLLILNYAGTAFILYLAYQIFTAPTDITADEADQPGFWQGALLQWLNPKAWIASLAGSSAFTNSGDLGSVVIFCGIYFCCCYCGVGFWAVLGAQARSLITHPDHLAVFHKIMGVALAAVGLYLFTQ